MWGNTKRVRRWLDSDWTIEELGRRLARNENQIKTGKDEFSQQRLYKSSEKPEACLPSGEASTMEGPVNHGRHRLIFFYEITLLKVTYGQRTARG